MPFINVMKIKTNTFTEKLQVWNRIFLQRLLWWTCRPVVTNPPSNAGDKSSIPGPGTNILHATKPVTTTTEPVYSGTCVPQLERSLLTATKTQHSQK